MSFVAVTLQLSGIVRVTMKPLVDKIPIIAGVTVHFLKQPVCASCLWYSIAFNNVYWCHRDDTETV